MNRITNRKRRDHVEIVTEENSQYYTLFASFTSADEAMRVLTEMPKTPVEVNNTELQNSSGANLFMIGYSIAGGPDVVG